MRRPGEASGPPGGAAALHGGSGGSPRGPLGAPRTSKNLAVVAAALIIRICAILRFWPSPGRLREPPGDRSEPFGAPKGSPGAPRASPGRSPEAPWSARGGCGVGEAIRLRTARKVRVERQERCSSCVTACSERRRSESNVFDGHTSCGPSTSLIPSHMLLRIQSFSKIIRVQCFLLGMGL